MKRFKERCGAALLEVLLSIAILGLLTVPISSGIMMSFHINERSDEIMQARLAVSSAVETIMASGIESTEAVEAVNLPGVKIEDVSEPSGGCWTLTVRSVDFPDVFVEMQIRSNSVRTSKPGGSGE